MVVLLTAAKASARVKELTSSTRFSVADKPDADWVWASREPGESLPKQEAPCGWSSANGQGTVFEVQLPLTSPPE